MLAVAGGIGSVLAFLWNMFAAYQKKNDAIIRDLYKKIESLKDELAEQHSEIEVLKKSLENFEKELGKLDDSIKEGFDKVMEKLGNIEEENKDFHTLLNDNKHDNETNARASSVNAKAIEDIKKAS